MARAAAVTVALLATFVIAAYFAHFDPALYVRHGLQGMSIVTAGGILLLAAGLLAQSVQWRHLSATLAACAVAVGATLLAAHALAGSDIISPALETPFGYAAAGAPRVSIASALCLIAIGLSIVLSRWVVVADTLALGVTVMTSFALVGYAYGVDDLYALSLFSTMALHTASAFLILSMVSVLARPESNWLSVIGSDSAAGAATRRQLAFTLIPPLGGWLLLRAIGFHSIGPTAAMALLVVATGISLGVLILRDGRRLVALDDERRAKLAVQTALQSEMESRLVEQERELTVRSVQRTQAEAALYKTQRLEALSQLSGGIAHDFNNLLQAIGGNLDLMGRRLEASHPARPLIDRARVAMQRGSKLSTQLLAFSKTQRLDIRLIEIDPALANAQTMLGAALGSAMRLVVEQQAPGQWVRADENQLQLALLNLALNAKDASAGRGEITVSSAVVSAVLSDGLAAQPCVAIRVRDHGEGMPPEVAARALEPFFTTKPAGTANGLGLAQVYGFVRQCGGNLRIETAPGQGTCIELLFLCSPAPLADSAATVRTAADPPRSAAQRLILVIEDDDSVRGVLVDGLRSAGYEVAQAADGAAGIALLDQLAPAAAVIDFVMPGLNGAQVAQQARRRRPTLPIVFVSGYFDTAALADIDHATMLRKPFTLDDLRAALQRALALEPAP